MQTACGQWMAQHRALMHFTFKALYRAYREEPGNTNGVAHVLE